MATSQGFARYVNLIIRRRNIRSIMLTLKISAISIIWIMVAFFLVYYSLNGKVKKFISDIDISHVEAFGIKISIYDKSSELSKKLRGNNDNNKYPLNPKLLDSARHRAGNNEQVIRGSRILWVDDQPENNTDIIDLLSKLGINVVSVTNNEDALVLVDNSHFDAIVTDGSRPDDMYRPQDKLIKCPLTYREVPRNRDATSVAQMNQMISNGRGIPGGFLLSEHIARRETDRIKQINDAEAYADFNFFDNGPIYTDITSPRIIMYSESNGDISYSPCLRTITRRIDYLFNSILSVLEENRKSIEYLPQDRSEDKFDR